MIQNRLAILTYPQRGATPVVAPAPVEAMERAARRTRRLRTLLLRVPVLHKILLASAGIVFLTTTLCVVAGIALLGLPLTAPALSTFVLLALVGALASAPLLVIILRLALRPVALLAEAAERFERGEEQARAPLSPLADPQLERLTLAYNRALDHIEADRERLRALAARAFDAQELERTRIARELQDEIAQNLASVLLRLRLARRTAEREECEHLFDELREQVMQTTDAVRRYARGLHPPALRELGLVAALETHTRTLAEATPLTIEVDADLVRGQLSPREELGAYRIVQEALANVVRHAHATEARVELAHCNGHVELTVADNGCGFPVDEVESHGSSLGLLGMKERALYLGGTTCIESAPGEGTRVRVRIPLAADNGGEPAPGE